MNSILAQSATRHYPIDDRWLAAHGGDNYVDIMEIRQNPSQSAYLQWMMGQGFITSYIQEQVKASFVDSGIRVGDGDSGNDIRGIMFDDSYIDDNEYSASINHPERYRRIYAKGTTARKISFVGVGSKSYDSIEHTTINANGVVQ